MKVLALFFVLIFGQAFAQNDIAYSDFAAGIKKFKVGSLSTQSYCYENAQGQQGFQIDRLQRIASVTKLLTTYFASENLDLHKKYTLKIYVTKDSLHIEGGRDPYFEEDKMFLLMKALNELGYKSFKSVTMDKNFIFSDEALSEYKDITPAYSRDRLAYFFNKANRRALLSKWNSVKTFALEEGVDLSKYVLPEITAASVQIEANPLLAENATVYVHQSMEFHRLLKAMNVQSKNIVAQNVFEEASRVKKFDDFMVESGFDKKDFLIYNGSGLPIINGSSRLDNLASCRLLLKLMPLLEKSLSKHQLIMSDIIAVSGGQDLGSFRNRFKPYPEVSMAVLSKTGTLMQTSTLAGLLMIDGKIPFAILNDSTNSSGSRNFQDFFVSRLFNHLGTPSPIPYQKISIFPYDKADFFATTLY